MAARLEPEGQALARARAEVGILARFDPAPEACLARRYEAAAERGMYRALRLMGGLRGDRGRERARGEVVEVERPAARVEAAAVAAGTPVPAPLGSFRAAEGPVVPLTIGRTGHLWEPSSEPTPGRARRPDVSKLGRKRR